MHNKDLLRLLYLSKYDIVRVKLGIDEIINLVENVFREKGAGNIEMPPKPGIHPAPDSFIHAMPAYVPSLNAAALKWVSGYPLNPTKSLPYITGLLILNAPETGLPLAVMDATWITAMRTAAASAVAAKHLANTNPQTLAVIGCGVQGRSHVEAMSETFTSLECITAFDISGANLARYVEDMSEKFPQLEFRTCASPREAVTEADIIVTAGPIKKMPEPGIEAGWTKPGAFASPVDFDTYWDRKALDEFDKIITDDVPQFRFYRQQGYFGVFPEVYGDLSDLLCSRLPGRTAPEERIMSMNLGLAIEDAAVARKLYDQAVELGIGQWLDR